ncbi:Hypothetical protein NTJ_03148 [Nesidiocoris tenuis]|uniref:Uncharacterized protein n=1 Tax=Nesidiocoris tenuis TaxID=355587 RepID=A0ABN7ADJ4_9HEMI|nr:Hypothetical protein NTJ_03148 [Nesidiocoris tenuis]
MPAPPARLLQQNAAASSPSASCASLNLTFRPFILQPLVVTVPRAAATVYFPSRTFPSEFLLITIRA